MQQLTLSSLTENHIDEISSTNNEPSWLKQYRKNSFTVYQDLPTEVSPLYNKYSDVNRMDPEQVSLSLSSDKSIPDFLKERLNEISKDTSIVQIGSNIQQINLLEDLKSKGLVISSIDEGMKNHSEIIRKSLEKTNPKEDKYTALNNAFFNSGIFIYIPKNMILEKPIHIVSSLPLDETSTISRSVIHTRSTHLIHTLICTNHSHTPHTHIHHTLTNSYTPSTLIYLTPYIHTTHSHTHTYTTYTYTHQTIHHTLTNSYTPSTLIYLTPYIHTHS